MQNDFDPFLADFQKVQAQGFKKNYDVDLSQFATSSVAPQSTAPQASSSFGTAPTFHGTGSNDSAPLPQMPSLFSLQATSGPAPPSQQQSFFPAQFPPVQPPTFSFPVSFVDPFEQDLKQVSQGPPAKPATQAPQLPQKQPPTQPPPKAQTSTVQQQPPPQKQGPPAPQKPPGGLPAQTVAPPVVAQQSSAPAPAPASGQPNPRDAANEEMKECFAALEKGEFTGALSSAERALKILSSSSTAKSHQKEVKVCVNYKILLQLLLEIKQSESNLQKSALLTRILAEISVQPKHQVICIRKAIKTNFEAQNYGTTARLIRNILPLKLRDQQALEEKLAQCEQFKEADNSPLLLNCPSCNSTTNFGALQCNACKTKLQFDNKTFAPLTSAEFIECTFCEAIFTKKTLNVKDRCPLCSFPTLVEGSIPTVQASAKPLPALRKAPPPASPATVAQSQPALPPKLPAKTPTEVVSPPTVLPPPPNLNSNSAPAPPAKPPKLVPVIPSSSLGDNDPFAQFISPPATPNLPPKPAKEKGPISDLVISSISDAEKAAYLDEFPIADRNHDEFVDGMEAKQYFSKFQLPNAALAQIWRLADFDQDGKLSVEQFFIALHYVHCSLAGMNLPEHLPESVKQSASSFSSAETAKDLPTPPPKATQTAIASTEPAKVQPTPPPKTIQSTPSSQALPAKVLPTPPSKATQTTIASTEPAKVLPTLPPKETSPAPVQLPPALPSKNAPVPPSKSPSLETESSSSKAETPEASLAPVSTAPSLPPALHLPPQRNLGAPPPLPQKATAPPPLLSTPPPVPPKATPPAPPPKAPVVEAPKVETPNLPLAVPPLPSKDRSASMPPAPESSSQTTKAEPHQKAKKEEKKGLSLTWRNKRKTANFEAPHEYGSAPPTLFAPPPSIEQPKKEEPPPPESQKLSAPAPPPMLVTPPMLSNKIEKNPDFNSLRNRRHSTSALPGELEKQEIASVAPLPPPAPIPPPIPQRDHPQEAPPAPAELPPPIPEPRKPSPSPSEGSSSSARPSFSMPGPENQRTFEIVQQGSPIPPKDYIGEAPSPVVRSALFVKKLLEEKNVNESYLFFADTLKSQVSMQQLSELGKYYSNLGGLWYCTALLREQAQAHVVLIPLYFKDDIYHQAKLWIIQDMIAGLEFSVLDEEKFRNEGAIEMHLIAAPKRVIRKDGRVKDIHSPQEELAAILDPNVPLGIQAGPFKKYKATLNNRIEVRAKKPTLSRKSRDGKKYYVWAENSNVVEMKKANPEAFCKEYWIPKDQAFPFCYLLEENGEKLGEEMYVELSEGELELYSSYSKKKKKERPMIAKKAVPSIEHFYVAVPVPPRTGSQELELEQIESAPPGFLSMDSKGFIITYTPGKVPRFSAEVSWHLSLRNNILKPRYEGESFLQESQPLTEYERKMALKSTSDIDYTDVVFGEFLARHSLIKGIYDLNEEVVSFVHRVYLHMVTKFEVGTTSEEVSHKASQVMRAGRSDSVGLSRVFVGALRHSGVPARVLYGRLSETNDPYAMAEFYLDDTGWIPIDLAISMKGHNPRFDPAKPETLTLGFGKLFAPFVVWSEDSQLVQTPAYGHRLLSTSDFTISFDHRRLNTDWRVVAKQ